MDGQIIGNKTRGLAVEREYISIFQLSDMISVPVGTLRNWLYRRVMPFSAYKINRQVRFKIQEIRDWMEYKGKEQRDENKEWMRNS